MHIYVKFILGKSTARENRMIKKKIKIDAAIMTGSVLAVGGAIVAAKTGGPSLIKKIKKLFTHGKEQNQSKEEESDQENNEYAVEQEEQLNFGRLSLLNAIKDMLAHEEIQRRKFVIGDHEIFVITDKKKIVHFIFCKPSTGILKNDHNLTLDEINQELMPLLEDIAREKRGWRIFIPMYEEFTAKTPFNSLILGSDNFFEYYPAPTNPDQNNQECRTKWDWTKEFYMNKKGSF
jgi:hypothetical protein